MLGNRYFDYFCEMITERTKDILFVLTVLVLTISFLERKNIYKKFQTSSKKEVEVTVNKVDTSVEHTSIKKEVKKTEVVNKTKKVYVRGLGNYSDDDLNEVSSYIREFYGYKCEIEPSVETLPEMYSEDGTSLEVGKCIGKLKRENIKTIYVTNENIVSDGLELRGGTIWRTNTVILESTPHNKKTVLHEIGHTLGLNHCEDKNCLMSIYNDGYEVKDFCNNCKKNFKLNENF